MEFNEGQLKVINAKEGFYLVLATAGSGKTASITERISKLIKDGIPSKNILALTFTNKAANEMQKRITKRVGENEAIISTFHSLAFSIFMEYSEQMGYKKNFEIVDRKYLKTKIFEIYKENNDIVKDTLDEIDNFIRDLEDLKKSYGDLTDYFSFEWNQIYRDLNNEMKKEGKVTYDDLLFETCKLLEEKDFVRKEYGNKFKYIIIDETQDTSPVQYKMIDLLAKHGNVMCVGDVSQAINSFNGSSVHNVFDFDKKYKPEIIYLDHNYRSSGSIIDVSNRVLEYSLYEEKMRKPAVPTKEQGNKPQFFMYEDEAEQAESIADQILNLVDNRNAKFGDIAVLYRNNKLSVDFERSFMARGIPFRVKSGEFIKRKEIQVLLSCLKLSIEDYDNERASNIVNISDNFNNKVSDKTIYSVFIHDKENRSFRDIVYSGEKIEGVGKVRLSALKDLCEFIDSAVAYIPKQESLYSSDSLSLVIGKIKDLMADISNNENEIESRKEALDNFGNFWASYLKEKHIKNEEASLGDFINSLTMNPKSKEEEEDEVCLSTVHSFKGLEADYVFVVTVKDGIFSREVVDTTEESYIDEICLWYVALSRAKKQMYITSIKKGGSWFYRENTYSLLQMFLDTDLIGNVNTYEMLIRKPTNFYIKGLLAQDDDPFS